jgi:hypothetical protein
LDINVPYDLSEFTPLISNQAVYFIQNQSFNQDQTRYEQKRDFDPVSSGYRNVGEPILEENTIVGNNTRTVEVIDLGWNDVGIIDNCNVWTPAVETILFDEEFTQERECEQDKARTLEYYVESILETNYIDNQTFPVYESQQASGTNSNTGWVESEPVFTSWEDIEGETYNYLDWTPELTGVLVSFTQSRDYDQEQYQEEQNQEFNTFTSEYRNVGEIIEHSQTRVASESREINVLVEEWINDEEYDCTNWTPDISTKEYGEVFIQTSSCSQNQVANVNYSFQENILNTEIINQTIINNKTKEEIGTNIDSGWVPIASDFTTWVDVGVGHTYLGGIPAIALQTSNFNQTQSYLQNQEKYEQPKEQNSFTNSIRNNGDQIKHPQSRTDSEDRLITVEESAWIDKGLVNWVSTWTEWSGASSARYMTRDYNNKEDKTITYKSSGTILSSNVESRFETRQKIRSTHYTYISGATDGVRKSSKIVASGLPALTDGMKDVIIHMNFASHPSPSDYNLKVTAPDGSVIYNGRFSLDYPVVNTTLIATPKLALNTKIMNVNGNWTFEIYDEVNGNIFSGNVHFAVYLYEYN